MIFKHVIKLIQYLCVFISGILPFLKGEYKCDLPFATLDFKTTQPNVVYFGTRFFLSQKQILCFRTLPQLSREAKMKFVTVYTSQYLYLS